MHRAKLNILVSLWLKVAQNKQNKQNRLYIFFSSSPFSYTPMHPNAPTHRAHIKVRHWCTFCAWNLPKQTKDQSATHFLKCSDHMGDIFELPCIKQTQQSPVKFSHLHKSAGSFSRKNQETFKRSLSDSSACIVRVSVVSQKCDTITVLYLRDNLIKAVRASLQNHSALRYRSRHPSTSNMLLYKAR